MLRNTLNLGILAHVDAGKTTLSERLLYAAGVIGEPGRVDDGTTQTDSLALERQRGITIRSAVVSLPIDGVSVNLIDTPGHPDFIAEVDRVLGVLDGAVLVISAVEGVQPQTRVLMRALRRLRVPTLLFVNKTDRLGADVPRTLAQVHKRLGVTAVPMDREPMAWLEALAAHDDELLAAYVEDESKLTPDKLWAELAGQTQRVQVFPAYAGSAFTGAGVEELMRGISALLPRATGDTEGPVSASVFKIERGPAGDKVAYVRMFGGTLRTREKIHDQDKITAINVFDHGRWERSDSVTAGQIGQLRGLNHLKVGAAIGAAKAQQRQHFALPTLEAVIEPVRHEDHVRLREALAQLAEQDPLIDVRDLSVSLYGEVQKEVIQATLAADFGVDVTFHETTTVYIERPAGVGEAIEVLNAPDNPFRATIGLRVEPLPPGSGIQFTLDVDFRQVPLFVYGNLNSFAMSMGEYVRHSLGEGLCGWPVSDCAVTMTASNYSSADGPPATRGPLSTAADFRKLTPMVLMQALRDAGTVVCEPLSRLRIDAPAAALGALLRALNKSGAAIEAQTTHDNEVTIEAVVTAAAVHGLHIQLPPLTGGEGVLESEPAGYQAVRGGRPTRRRTTSLKNS
ncbi:MAG TPA: translation factor GTPase family protein [Candidatus Limnocylindrales bacterium]|nr:translation factor GTPase family protein [Candidatus Limnocylindrales bacterium]